MIPTDLLEMLRCPQSGQRLTIAGSDVLETLNARIGAASSAGQGVTNAAGVKIDQPMTAALLRADRLMLYPMDGEIPVLLAEEAILL